jgi:maltose O-acetyltransferase
VAPLLAKIARSLARDRALPLGARLAKGRRYLAASALARWRLRACDRVGARARVMGRPVVRNAGAITVGDDLILNARHAPCELAAAPDARLAIGSHAVINFGTLLHAARAVTIGDRVTIGPYSIVSDADLPDGSDARPVEIGDGVWLAGRVTVRPGARIGAGTVVAAGSVVVGELPAGVLAGGNPARVLRPLHAPPVALAAPAPALAVPA